MAMVATGDFFFGVLLRGVLFFFGELFCCCLATLFLGGVFGGLMRLLVFAELALSAEVVVVSVLSL